MTRGSEPELYGFGLASPALTLLDRRQRRAAWILSSIVIAVCLAGILWIPSLTQSLLVGVGCIVLFVPWAARGLIIFQAFLRRRGSLPAPRPLPEGSLPRYTVLVPLYQEANMIIPLIGYLRTLDYPVSRLEILLLCEADDEETIAEIDLLDPDPPFRRVVCPPGQPRTKPRACNIGLQLATGDLCVIFDAEDRPEVSQLRRAAETFAVSGDEVICLQARLDYHNHRHNMLARWFTVEYGVWFGLLLPSLAGRDLPIPLGGTSNHFRTEPLRRLGGWDPYNVTEDADLGVRLHRSGSRTRMLLSTTYEEACAVPGPWIRQRTRWMKGYLQTWAVHSRRSAGLSTRLHSRLAVHLFVGGTPLSALVYAPMVLALPLLWARSTWLAASVTVVVGFVSGTLAAFGMVYAVSARRWHLLVSALTFPVYFLLVSAATYRGLWQLLVRPHVWEKTPHGLTGHDTDPALVTDAPRS
jgi:cellulose synthase/poly-beta-1,6-N-acetylglucosamine synthase-like glycosyltransferase